ncbi:MAG TPA: hypothetical protein VGN87_06245 [Paenibacillus sp.]
MEVSTLAIGGFNIPHTQKADLVLGKPFYIERVLGNRWDIFTHSITLPAGLYDKINEPGGRQHFALLHQASPEDKENYTLHQGFTEYCAATTVERDGDSVHLKQARFRITPYLGVKK